VSESPLSPDIRVPKDLVNQFYLNIFILSLFSYSDMGRDEFSAMVQSLAKHNKPNLKLRGNNRQLQLNPDYLLVDMPIVYHILVNQNNNGIGSPSATQLQLNFMTAMTNKLYEVYDKSTLTSVNWATFVEDPSSPIEHTGTFNKDCGSLTDLEIQNIVSAAPEWQYKLHCIICESNQWSGVASFPSSYSVGNPRHNMVRVEYRAVACYDEDGNFLCDLTDGQISHTRWWRTRSTVLAHEIGTCYILVENPRIPSPIIIFVTN
jgi:hypothetical protein